MNKNTFLIATLAIGATSILMASVWTTLASASTEAGETNPDATVVRDSVVVLGPKTIPPNDYIHLYDTTPYMIMNGHVAAKLPCDENSESLVQILIGQAPDLKPAEFELISELSTPGELCLYHVDLASEHGEDVEGGIVTDVAIYNPTDERIRLPLTSSIVIGINEIMPIMGEDTGHDEEESEDSMESP